MAGALAGYVGVATWSTLGKGKRARFANLRVQGSHETREVPAAAVAPMAAVKAPASAAVDAALDSSGVGNLVSMGGMLFTTNCGPISAMNTTVQCWLLRAPTRTTTTVHVWTCGPQLDSRFVSAACGVDQPGNRPRRCPARWSLRRVQLPPSFLRVAGGSAEFPCRAVNLGRPVAVDGSGNGVERSTPPPIYKVKFTGLTQTLGQL